MRAFINIKVGQPNQLLVDQLTKREILSINRRLRLNYLTKSLVNEKGKSKV